jgi:hypothetical protein
MQRARDRDVVDVVAGGLRQRPILAPAGDAPVDQPWIAREARLGAEPEPFGHAGTKAFDQRVGLFRQRQHDLDCLRLLEIEGDRAPAARHHVELGIERQAEIGALEPIDAQDVGAHVGEQHAAEWSGPDPGQLQNAHAREWTAHRTFPDLL